MSVLDQIVARKRIDVAQRKARTPTFEPVQPRQVHQFSEALRQPGTRFIMECKQASPSAGRLREDFDPLAVAAAYADCADAISILTDEPFFQGSLDHLRAIRAQTHLPLLCKDFIFDPWQIEEAHAAGADAVLLMLSVLDDADWRDCARVAAALGMDVLTEAHDAAELDRAIALGAEIIGINNRDLKTLRVDLGTTGRLAPRIPADRLVVCESGIRGRADIEAVDSVVDAFLVGSELMRAPCMATAARQLVYGRVKVCGLTSASAAQMARRAGASLGGVIFVADSPRCVGLAEAQLIGEHGGLPLVGVFADAPALQVAALAQQLELVAVQLHGEESSRYISELREHLPVGCEVWKALHPQGVIPGSQQYGADRLLLDGPHGGSGRPFDWSLLDGHGQCDSMVLAGGLDAANAREALRLGCFALDVNSGVESSPGIKSQARLEVFFAALRGA